MTGIDFHGEGLMNVENILKAYGLTRTTATDYLRTIVRCNQSDAARRSGLSRDTINRYKTAFEEMTEIERAFVIHTLMEEHFVDLVHQRADAEESG